MNLIIIIDLDDTLYEEKSFVLNGFVNVAFFLKQKFKLNKNQLYKNMKQTFLKEGRDKVFDKVLSRHNILTKKNLNNCVQVYRYKKKNIKLRKDALNFLNSYHKYGIYLVSDGNKKVQQCKIDLLKIKKYFKKIYLTHRYKKIHSKPSTYCFKKIKNIEKCQWNDMVYIGDNILKDFVNLNKLGVNTIRVLKGNYKYIKKNKIFEAKYKINNLYALNSILKKIILLKKK